MDNLIMGVKDYKSINRAGIEINRINVITGVNGSGKSTLSKILYSFLAANSKKRKDLILEILIRHVNGIIDYLESVLDKEILPEHFSTNDSYDEILDNYNKLFEIAEDFENSADERKKELYDVLLEKLNEINKLLVDEGFSEENLLIPSMIDDLSEFINRITSINESVSQDIKNKLNDIEFLIFEYSHVEDEAQYASMEMKLVTHDLMNLIYGKDEPLNSFKIMFEILGREFIRDIDNFAFFIGKDKNQSFSVAFDYFFENGFIDNVFYVDNVSILDLKYSDKKLIHMDDLFNNLGYLNSKSNDNKSQLILEKIENIIKGSYDNPNFFRTEISVPEDEPSYIRLKKRFSRFGMDLKKEDRKVRTTTHNTASGIKQIGIIQILLGNNKLKEDDYLIIDEPEVNLHPEWQFKFAEILVLLARDLKINVYLNSHSPFFVEAIDAFTEFYDMQDEINYYLAEESQNEGKYDFNKIGSDELYKIYDNLGRPYDLIDQLRLQKHLGE